MVRRACFTMSSTERPWLADLSKMPLSCSPFDFPVWFCFGCGFLFWEPWPKVAPPNRVWLHDCSNKHKEVSSSPIWVSRSKRSFKNGLLYTVYIYIHILWIDDILYYLRNPGMMINTNKQWFPLLSKWCRILFIHSMLLNSGDQSLEYERTHPTTSTIPYHCVVGRLSN